MRGGDIHNDVLIRPVEQLLKSCGATTAREHPVGWSSGRGAIDLVAWMPGRLIVAIEAELGPRRVSLDLVKAEAVEAGLLCIVTPSPSVARACRRRVSRESIGTQIEILVHPLPLMLARLADRFPLIHAAE